MRHRVQADRCKRLDADPEAGSNDHHIGFDTFAIRELDIGDVAAGISGDPVHRSVANVHAAGSERVELSIWHINRAVEDNGEPAGQVAEQDGGGQPHRVGHDLDHPPVPGLEALTERTLDDIASPALCEAIDLGKHIDQARGAQDPTGDDGVTSDELDPNAVVFDPGHAADPTGEDLAAVAADLVAAGRGQLRRWGSVSAEVAVHVSCGCVARLAGVDNDHRPALSCQLEGGGQSGGGSADDSDVAVSLDGLGWVIVVMNCRVRSVLITAYTLAEFARLWRNGV